MVNLLVSEDSSGMLQVATNKISFYPILKCEN